MLAQTKLLLKMPVVLTTLVTALFFAVLVALWLLVLRSNRTDEPMKEAQQAQEIATEVKERPVVMTLMVLSWSEGLRARYERFVNTVALNDEDSVVLSTKYAASVVKNVAAVAGYLDSLASKEAVDKDTISLASLPTVLQNGFANARNASNNPHHIVVLGGFPGMPSVGERTSRKRSLLILADCDYLWLAKSSQHKVAFIWTKSDDALRRALQKSMDEATITYRDIH